MCRRPAAAGGVASRLALVRRGLAQRYVTVAAWYRCPQDPAGLTRIVVGNIVGVFSREEIGGRNGTPLKSWAYRLVGILVSVLFVYLTVRKVNPSDFLNAFGSVSLPWLLAAVAIYLSGFPFRALRWQRILREQKELSLREVMVPVLIGRMANNVLPAQAGEIYRAILLGKRTQISRSGALGSIVVERTLDGLMLVAIILFVFYLFPGAGFLGWAALLSGLLFVALAMGILLYGHTTTGTDRFVIWLLDLLPPPLRKFVGQRLELFLSGIRGLSTGKRYVETGVHTIVIWACEAVAVGLVVASFDIALPFGSYLLVFSLASLSTVLPSGLGYIGPYQYAFVLGLGYFEVDREMALAVSIVAQAALLGPITVIGLALLWREHSRLKPG